MVDRLAEVISNGGGVAHEFHTDFVHNYSVRKIWFFFFKASSKLQASLYVYIITIVHHFNRQ